MEGIAWSKYIDAVLPGILSKLLCWTQGQNSFALPLRTLQVEWQRAASSRKGSEHQRSGIWFCSRIHVFAGRWGDNVQVFDGRIICLAMVHCHIFSCIVAGDRIVQGERASSPSLYLSLIVETNAQNPTTKQHEDTNKEALPIAQGGH